MKECLHCRGQIPDDMQWCSVQCKERFYENNFNRDFSQRIEQKKEEERQKIINSPDHQAFMKRASEVGYSQAIYELSKNNELPIENDIITEKPKKDNWFKKLWNMTIFSEWIKEAKERKKVERELKRKAKLKALEGMEDELAEKYKKQEIEKMTSGGVLGKIGKGLSKIGEEFKNSDFASNEKMERILGRGSNPGRHVDRGFGGTGASNQEISHMMGAGRTPNVDPSMLSRRQESQQKDYSSFLKSKGNSGNDKISQMLGRKKSNIDPNDKIRQMLK